MKIKSYKLFENDSEELNKSIKELERSIRGFKSFIQMKNRSRLVNKEKIGDLSKDFEHYFYDLIDDGWEIFGDHDPTFYYHIRLKNPLKREGIEDEVNNIIDRMSEVRDRLGEEGFDSKFIINVNGKPQQVQNPDSYKVPIYKFTGIGDEWTLKYHKDGKYSEEEYVFAIIDYYII